MISSINVHSAWNTRQSCQVMRAISYFTSISRLKMVDVSTRHGCTYIHIGIRLANFTIRYVSSTSTCLSIPVLLTGQCPISHYSFPFDTRIHNPDTPAAIRLIELLDILYRWDCISAVAAVALLGEKASDWKTVKW